MSNKGFQEVWDSSYNFSYPLNNKFNRSTANTAVSCVKPPLSCNCMDVKLWIYSVIPFKSAPFVLTILQLVNNVDACWLCKCWTVIDLSNDRFLRRKYFTEMIQNYFYTVLTNVTCIFFCILKIQLSDKICARNYRRLHTRHRTEFICYNKCLILQYLIHWQSYCSF